MLSECWFKFVIENVDRDIDGHGCHVPLDLDRNAVYNIAMRRAIIERKKEKMSRSV